jgi:hypothetical protein
MSQDSRGGLLDSLGEYKTDVYEKMYTALEEENHDLRAELSRK